MPIKEISIALTVVSLLCVLELHDQCEQYAQAIEMD